MAKKSDLEIRVGALERQLSALLIFVEQTAGRRPKDTLLSVEAAEKVTGYSRHKLYRLAAQGRIPHVRDGRAVRFEAGALEHWINSRQKHFAHDHA